ncbi:WDR78 protein, partial [Chroicocephalus maculipennis]|nr:WDR78 protein [Chroicocephalus maculipennis]
PPSRLLTPPNFTDVQGRQEAPPELLTNPPLDRSVDIYLTAPPTIWIFPPPSVVVSVESEAPPRIQERNSPPADICKPPPGNDRFVEKMMQTINGAAKNKEVQCDQIIMDPPGTTVTPPHLYNSSPPLKIKPTSKAEPPRATAGTPPKPHTTKEHDQPPPSPPFPYYLPPGSTSSSTMISAPPVLARNPPEEEYHSEVILTPPKFQQDPPFMERILMENISPPKLAAYPPFPVLIDPDVTSDTSRTVAAVKEAKEPPHGKEKTPPEEQKEAFIDPSILSDVNKILEEIVPPSLERPPPYACDSPPGHSVSSMAWSPPHPDLLAVGYGAFDFKEQKKGLACCWSLKNPMAPPSQFERIPPREHGVTPPDFSMASPSLLAVGMYNGSVAIYNSSNKPPPPVWQLRWVEQPPRATGDTPPERLICISADGPPPEWLVPPPLDCTALSHTRLTKTLAICTPPMKIKRPPRKKKKLPDEKERKSEALISQQAAGMCFDFHPPPGSGSPPPLKYYPGELCNSPPDTNFYLAGTEEGHIHKCSCSSREQFLKTYRGHKFFFVSSQIPPGPVYKPPRNPFSTDMFLSPPADWSIPPRHQDSQTPLLTPPSTTAVPPHVMWSPKSAFVFAAAKESRVEIWDLSVSIPREKFTSVPPATNTDPPLVGDSNGEVGVPPLQNLAPPHSNKVQLTRKSPPTSEVHP